MKKVVVLIKGLGRGGAEQLLLSAAPFARGFEYHIAYLLPWKNALEPQLRNLGVEVSCLNGSHGVGWVLRFESLLRRLGVSLVHAHSPYPAAWARVATPRGLPFVYTEHGTWEHYRSSTYWGNAATFARNNHVFAVAKHVDESIRYPLPLRWRRMPVVETLYHGLDVDSVMRWSSTDGVRSDFGIDPDVPLIGTVANFRTVKGHRYLLEAAVAVRHVIPDARFVLVGAGPAEVEIRRLIDEFDLNETVLIAGFREDAPRFTRAFDVFVLPSLHEGLPIAVLEAMALSRPVVATRVGGVPEVVQDGVNGILVAPRDAAGLADAILALACDPRRRADIGRAAHERSKSFDIRRAAARIEEVYEELTG